MREGEKNLEQKRSFLFFQRSGRLGWSFSKQEMDYVMLEFLYICIFIQIPMVCERMTWCVFRLGQ